MKLITAIITTTITIMMSYASASTALYSIDSSTHTQYLNLLDCLGVETAKYDIHHDNNSISIDPINDRLLESRGIDSTLHTCLEASNFTASWNSPNWYMYADELAELASRQRTGLIKNIEHDPPVFHNKSLKKKKTYADMH